MLMFNVLQAYLLFLIPFSIAFSVVADILGKKTIAVVAGIASSAYILFMDLVLGTNSGRIGITGLEVNYDLVTRAYILLVGVIGLAVYSYMYLTSIRDEMPFNNTVLTILLHSIVLIVLVDNWIIFVFLWETVSYTIYHLMQNTSLKDGKPGYLYYLTTHIGGFMLIGGVSLLASHGILSMHQSIPGIQAALILLVVGLLTKTGAVPFHYWVQPIYSSTRPLYAALLSGIVDELGVYGLYRVLAQASIVYRELGALILLASFASIIAANIWYWSSRSLRSILAWSTIYNIGWMLALTSLNYLVDIRGVELVLALYVVSHGLAKTSAFLLVDAFGDNHRVYRNMSLGASIGLASSLLAVEGFPPFNLFISKLHVLENILAYSNLLFILFALTWVTGSIYFLKIVHETLFPGNEAEKPLENRMLGGLAWIIGFLLLLSITIYPVLVYINRLGEVFTLW